MLHYGASATRRSVGLPALIEHYQAAFRPFVDLFPVNSCIEQTRMLKECLGSFGVEVVAQDTVFKAELPRLKACFVCGLEKQERERASRGALNWRDEVTEETAGVGHVVGIARRGGEQFLVDPTVSQAERMAEGLRIERDILTAQLPEFPAQGSIIEMSIITGGDEILDVSWWFSGRRMFEATPAWEPSHLWRVIARIKARIQWRLDNSIATN